MPPRLCSVRVSYRNPIAAGNNDLSHWSCRRTDFGSLTWEPFDTGAYAVQSRDDLRVGKWRNAPGAWPITDTTWTDEDISLIRIRYYRIISR